MFHGGQANFLGKDVLTSFSSVIITQVLWTVFARTRRNHLIHMVELLSRKLSKNLKKRMIQMLIRSRNLNGKGQVAETWAMRKAGLRKLSKCELGEEY